MIKRRYLLAGTVLAAACSTSPPQVARGPDGTVFGRSVKGSVINVVPNEPALSPQDAAILQQYTNLIEKHVHEYWISSVTTSAASGCEVRIRVDQSGTVTEALIRAESTESVASAQGCDGVIDAVLRSAPLPEPPGSWVSQHQLDLVVDLSQNAD